AIPEGRLGLGAGRHRSWPRDETAPGRARRSRRGGRAPGDRVDRRRDAARARLRARSDLEGRAVRGRRGAGTTAPPRRPPPRGGRSRVARSPRGPAAGLRGARPGRAGAAAAEDYLVPAVVRAAARLRERRERGRGARLLERSSARRRAPPVESKGGAWRGGG